MTEYRIELYGKNGSSEPDCVLFEDTNKIEKAAVEAVKNLKKLNLLLDIKRFGVQKF